MLNVFLSINNLSKLKSLSYNAKIRSSLKILLILYFWIGPAVASIKSENLVFCRIRKSRRSVFQDKLKIPTKAYDFHIFIIDGRETQRHIFCGSKKEGEEMFYLVRLTPNIHNASYHYVCSRHKNNTYIFGACIYHFLKKVYVLFFLEIWWPTNYHCYLMILEK